MGRRDFRKTDRKNPAIAPEDRALLTLRLPLPVTLGFALRAGVIDDEIEIVTEDRVTALQVRSNRTLRHAFQAATDFINGIAIRRKPLFVHVPFWARATLDSSSRGSDQPVQSWLFTWLDGNSVAHRGLELTDPIVIQGKKCSVTVRSDNSPSGRSKSVRPSMPSLAL